MKTISQPSSDPICHHHLVEDGDESYDVFSVHWDEGPEMATLFVANGKGAVEGYEIDRLGFERPCEDAALAAVEVFQKAHPALTATTIAALPKGTLVAAMRAPRPSLAVPAVRKLLGRVQREIRIVVQLLWARRQKIADAREAARRRGPRDPYRTPFAQRISYEAARLRQMREARELGDLQDRWDHAFQLEEASAVSGPVRAADLHRTGELPVGG